MAFGTSLALSTDSPSDADTNTQAFVLRFNDESKGVYSVAGLTSPEELKLTISHEVGSKGEKRHLARVDHTKADSITGALITITAYLVFVDPIGTAFSETLKKALVYRLIDLLIEGGAGAPISALLNSET
jgi:hypothetical protein